MTPTQILAELRQGTTIELPLDELSFVLADCDPTDAYQIVLLVTKGNAYLQIYQEAKPKTYQLN